MSTTTEIMITYLVRHGAVPEVLKGAWSGSEPLDRGTIVVIQTHRGLGLGTILESVRPAYEPNTEELPPSSEILRRASAEDLKRGEELAAQSQTEFHAWEDRITQWGLDLQLIDLEWTLDGAKVVLYVLNERGPECTKLALQAAAAGLGIVEVQPVSLDGLVNIPTGGGGGCGSCGAHERRT